MTTAANLVGERVMGGDPWAVTQVAQRLQRLAGDANLLRERFKDGQRQGIWTGDAADAFARALQDIPRDLEKVHHSYVASGAALRRYADALQDVQEAARTLARRSTEAHDRRTVALSDRDRQRAALKSAKSARSAAVDPYAQSQADRKIATASAGVSAAERWAGEADGELRTVGWGVRDALSVFEAEARRCRDELHRASELGIRNNAWSWVDRRADNPFVEFLVSPFTGLAELIMNPGDLAAWRAALDGISNALAMAGTILALAAFAFPVLFVPAAIVSALGVGFAAAAMAVDVERVRRGELDESELIWDAVGVFGSAIPGGKMGTKGLKALRGYRATPSKGWKTRYRRYGPSGRKPTTGSKVKDLAWETGGWVAKISEELDERLNEPHPLTGICGPAARGPAVSPLALIRHTRPITVKPASFAGATP